MRDRLRQLLAAWAYRYSSMVCLQDEDAILLEVEGSLGLFGPWPQLERQLRADFTVLLTAKAVHSLYSPRRRQWIAL